MTRYVSCDVLKDWLYDGREIALFDVREFGEFSQAHIFLAGNLPYSRLELDVLRLVPNKSTRFVLCDDGLSYLAQKSARHLLDMGYRNVWILRGGTSGWSNDGLTLFGGVNVPSKTFGELVEQLNHTPQITALDLKLLTEKGGKVAIIDGRPFSEFQQMSIPGAICCPNGELANRVQQIVPDTSTTIVVNCAGRTRSLIGAQTLINLGLENQIFALENGTQGWFLSDLDLAYGASDRYPDSIVETHGSDIHQAARLLSEKFSVAVVGAHDVSQWLQDKERTVYLCDVRTAEEYNEFSLPGAIHAPGGQLVQATDEYLGVRNSRVVLFDTDGTRSRVTASWLKQMGWDVSVLSEGVSAVIVTNGVVESKHDSVPLIDCGEAAKAIKDGCATMYDVRSSSDYLTEHPKGAIWSIRPIIGTAARMVSQPIIILADDPGIAALVRKELLEIGKKEVFLLAGGFAAWIDGGWPTESNSIKLPYEQRIDYLFFEHELQEDKEAARRYLKWEIDLISQLAPQERAIFKI